MWHQWLNHNYMKQREYIFWCATNRKEKKLLNKVVIFVLFEHKNSLESFTVYSWTTDVTWTILVMFLLPFWALNVSVALLSMQGQKALRFHQKHLHLCSEDEWTSYGFWNDKRVGELSLKCSLSKHKMHFLWLHCKNLLLKSLFLRVYSRVIPHRFSLWIGKFTLQCPFHLFM